MVKFEGRWKYQSYRPDPGSVATDPNPPTFVPWSPRRGNRRPGRNDRHAGVHGNAHQARSQVRRHGWHSCRTVRLGSHEASRGKAIHERAAWALCPCRARTRGGQGQPACRPGLHRADECRHRPDSSAADVHDGGSSSWSRCSNRFSQRQREGGRLGDMETCTNSCLLTATPVNGRDPSAQIGSWPLSTRRRQR